MATEVNSSNEPLTCPRCRLLNPPGSLRCDCGHTFAKGDLSMATAVAERGKASLVISEDGKVSRVTRTCGFLLVVIAALMIAGNLLALYGADTEVDGRTYLLAWEKLGQPRPAHPPTVAAEARSIRRMEAVADFLVDTLYVGILVGLGLMVMSGNPLGVPLTGLYCAIALFYFMKLLYGVLVVRHGSIVDFFAIHYYAGCVLAIAVICLVLKVSKVRDGERVYQPRA